MDVEDNKPKKKYFNNEPPVVAPPRDVKKQKAGIKPKYTDEMIAELCPTITKFMQLGATDKELASFLNLRSINALVRYRKRYPALDEAIIAGKLYSDANVAGSLYRRAIGYDFEEVEEEVSSGSNGIPITKVKKRMKHIPGDTSAAIFWLTNRHKNVWKRAQEVITKPIEEKKDENVLHDDFKDISNDDLQKIVSNLEKEINVRAKSDVITLQNDEYN